MEAVRLTSDNSGDLTQCIKINLKRNKEGKRTLASTTLRHFLLQKSYMKCLKIISNVNVSKTFGRIVGSMDGGKGRGERAGVASSMIPTKCAMRKEMAEKLGVTNGLI